MQVVVLRPYTKFEVRRPCRSEDMGTMCVSINGPGDPDFDLWPWNWYASRIKGEEPSFQVWAR